MTSWEKEILVVLANHVRMLSLPQVARTWWTENRRGLRRARESAQRLAEEGWLDSYRVFSRPVAPLSEPLVVWTVSQRPPDFPQLSAWLHRRASASAAVTTVITAARKTHSLFGHGVVPSRPKLTQITHDLHVARHTDRIMKLSDGHIVSDEVNLHPIMAGTPRVEEVI